LKRVRLNVRLSSYGEQIPWETTSLETDVFLFSEGQKKLTDAELEKQIEADLAEWARIKSSRNIDDWVAYLRNFPNGRFAEIGQVRLARLLEEKAKLTAAAVTPMPASASTPAMASTPTTQTAPATLPTPTAAKHLIELAPDKPVPELFQPSLNPYSAGFYPLGRKFTVGDRATFRVSDIFSGAEQRTYTQLVTKVDLEADRVEYNMGGNITDLMGNLIKSGKLEFSIPIQFSPAELQVGKKWSAAFSQVFDNKTSVANYDLQIVRKEKVAVPAGEFEAFRVEGLGWNMSFGTRLETTYWLVPGLNFPIKREFTTRLSNGTYKNAERYELISLRQQSTGI